MKKSKGSASTIIYGSVMLVITAMLTIVILQYISTKKAINTIDNIFTGAILGSAIVNIDALDAKNNCMNSGQTIFSDGDIYGNGYTKVQYDNDEKSILASERTTSYISNNMYQYRDGASVTQASNITDMRIGFSSTDYYTADTSSRTLKSDDKHMSALFNNIIDTLRTGVYNKPTEKNDVVNIIEGTAGIPNKLKNNLAIPIDTTNQLSGTVEDNVEITKVQVYNVYRYMLARRHVYASPFMSYSVNGTAGYMWDGNSSSPKLTVNVTGSTKTTNAVCYMVNNTDSNKQGIKIEVTGWVGPTSEAALKDFLLNLFGWSELGSDADPIETTPMYQWYLTIWQRDYNAWNNRNSNPLVLWECSGISYAGDWFDTNNVLNKEYGYLWTNNKNVAIPISTDTLQEITNLNGTVVRLLPISGYSSYMYSKNDATLKMKYNNWMPKILSTSVGYGNASDIFAESKKSDAIRIGDYNKAIDNNNNITEDGSHKLIYGQTEWIGQSAIFAELTYRINAFDTISDLLRINKRIPATTISKVVTVKTK